ncbi:macrolide-specific efflux system membrane fusion protein [Paraburkholderia eburnea]|uniref:Macrolide-specific efflux system membrane fusion protein n=1 Tax=Paraburkholderia eburnea TaxID=1189126 RepID=A0A2S4LV29_9BURK|nr:efflux RND transporter periplasmic adaptor subunit [Paraburkholderia eburnea]POR46302.1 macrolide-specific efflux system membrane fusion protein [Paraburkholderia eburnea]PRZ16255.1 macrolide-specific efflux system membrane fusion protein [Paraburkholderia eburnea]
MVPDKIPRVPGRKILVVLPLVLLAFLLWWTLLRTRTIVDTTPVGRGDIELSVSALGTLQPQSYVDVGAQASGEIRRIAVQPGSVVRKGDLLVEIDPSVQQAKVDADHAVLDSLRAQLDGGEASAVLARQQDERQRRMDAEGATRAEDRQMAQATLRSAQAHVVDLRAQIAGASSTLKGDQAQLGYTRIYAPMAGTVITLDAREGQTLNATYQTPKILRVADLSTMTVWTEVSEADVRRVHPGMPVYFTTLGDDRRWTGTVRQVLPAPPNAPADASSPTEVQKGAGTGGAGKVVLYTVLFDVRNADHALMPQMSAQVFFVEASAHGVVLAPLAALQAVAGKTDVYTAQVRTPGGDIVAREVRTGVHDRLRAQVLAGLQPGELLVTGIRRERAAAGRFQW